MTDGFSAGEIFTAALVAFVLFGASSGLHYLTRFSRQRFLNAIQIPVRPTTSPPSFVHSAIPAAVKVDHREGLCEIVVALELPLAQAPVVGVSAVGLGEVRERAPDLWRLVCFYSYLAEWSSMLSLYVGFIVALFALVALADDFRPNATTLLVLAVGMGSLGAVNFASRRHCQFVARRHGLSPHPDVEF
jgi:hypothetical protein